MHFNLLLLGGFLTTVVCFDLLKDSCIPHHSTFEAHRNDRVECFYGGQGPKTILYRCGASKVEYNFKDNTVHIMAEKSERRGDLTIHAACFANDGNQVAQLDLHMPAPVSGTTSHTFHGLNRPCDIATADFVVHQYTMTLTELGWCAKTPIKPIS